MGRKSLADQRRAEILTAFFDCVEDQGFGGASLRKVAARAGVQTSVLHHYFSGREEMIQELVRTYTEDLFDDFEQFSRAEGDPRTRLIQGIEFIFSPAMINPRSNGFFMECCAQARTSPAVRESLARLFERFRGAIAGQLAALPAFEGRSRAELDALAALITAMHEGMELQWFADPGAVDLDRAGALVREWIDHLSQIPE